MIGNQVFQHKRAKLGKKRLIKPNVLLPVSVAIVSSLASGQVLAEESTLPIQKLSVNDNQNIVIDFGPKAGIFPQKPTLQDVTGANHHLVLDFPDAAIDRAVMPSAAKALSELTKAFPDVRGIRYAALTGGIAPTARIVLELPQSLEIKPHVVNIGETSITIDLGLNQAGAAHTDTTAQSSPVDSVAAATPTSTFNPLASQPTGLSTDGTRIQPVEMNPPQAVTAATPESKGDATHAFPSVESNPTSSTVVSPLANAEAEPAAAAALGAAENTSRDDHNARTGQESSRTTKNDTPSAYAQMDDDAMTGAAPEAAAGSSTKSSDASQDQSQGADKTALALPEASSPEKRPTVDENSDTLETRKSESGTNSVQPDQESKATIAASGGKGYDPNVAREAAAAADISETSADATGVVASAAMPSAAKETGAGAASAQRSAETRAEAERHFKNAVRLHMAGEWSAAIDEYKTTIAINPNLAEPYSNLGLIYNQQHKYPQAIDEFHKALAISPRDAITYNGVGAALRAQKDLVGAIKNWQAAVKFDPKLATAHYNLGTAYEMEKEYDKALNAYKQAVTLDGHLGEAYYRMGLISQRNNDATQAIEDFNKALKASTKADFAPDARQRIALLSKKVSK